MSGSTYSYKPPYDSPIEDAFAQFLAKYLSASVAVSTQVEFLTICGLFRLDFVVTSSDGRKTGFECDGKEFHDASRDEWRDAMILGSNEIHEIYRVRGKEATYCIEDVFYAISLWSPWLFDDRQKYILSRIASEEITARDIKPEDTTVSVNYIDAETDLMNTFRLEKRHKQIPENRRQFWQSAYLFAKNMGGGNLDEIISLYRNKQPA